MKNKILLISLILFICFCLVVLFKGLNNSNVYVPDTTNKILKEFKTHLNPGGILIVEVPHAKDFLLSNLKNEDFKNFTLWSQHLILHTRESLQRFLQ